MALSLLVIDTANSRVVSQLRMLQIIIVLVYKLNNLGVINCVKMM